MKTTKVIEGPVTSQFVQTGAWRNTHHSNVP